jgi:hypothetical protein
LTGFDQKIVSGGFYANEIEDELSSWNMTNLTFRRTIKYKHAIVEIEGMRQQIILYPHVCSKMGEKRGCPNLIVADGVWKIAFHHMEMKVSLYHVILSIYYILSFLSVKEHLLTE